MSDEYTELDEKKVKRAFARVNDAHIRQLKFYGITIKYASTDDGLRLTAAGGSISVTKVVPWRDIINNDRDPIKRERYVALCELLRLIEDE